MIQRIQTVFLLLAGLILAGLFLFPLATSETASGEILQDKAFTITDSPILMIITVLAIILPVATIFLYNNRRVQILLSKISGISALAVLIAAVVILVINNLFNANNLQVGLGIILVIISTVLSFLASRYIRKDEKLVRSIDRLR